MTLIPRPMNKHARLMGWGDYWGPDDYVILDHGGRSVGRIYKDYTQGSPRWFWSVNTSPFPAPPANNSLAYSLDEAKDFSSRIGQVGLGGKGRVSLELLAILGGG
jgi:hypothetical protein